jgi:predicted acylesterase/phospholipase RssA
LRKKGYSPYATFADLPKDVRLIAYNHTREKEMVFSKERSPNASVVEAVRASTGLVPIYQPLRWTDEHGRVYELTDGGLINPYPIDIFDEDKNGRGLPPTVGLRLTAGWGVENDGDPAGDHRRDSEKNGIIGDKSGESFLEYLISHITKSLDTEERSALRRSEWRRSINIYVGNIRTVDFLTIGDDQEKKTWLMAQGNRAVQEYIDYVDGFLFLAEPLQSLFFGIRNAGKYVRHRLK